MFLIPGNAGSDIRLPRHEQETGSSRFSLSQKIGAKQMPDDAFYRQKMLIRKTILHLISFTSKIWQLKL